MIVQFRNEKVSNHGSIPITIDCNVVAFIVFEEGFHQLIKRTKHRYSRLSSEHHLPRASASFRRVKASHLGSPSARESGTAVLASLVASCLSAGIGSPWSSGCGGGLKRTTHQPSDAQLSDALVKIVSTKKKPITVARHNVTVPR
ncbi:hypothetical protein TNCV_3229801 [Trichonephila clavipes]|nr:hypothetical protein TNCV_3229801 [Trichonephila clavipes]